MRLLEIKIIDLFNIFTHQISFNQDDRVTIITAPNGYGKTIALKTIYSLFNKKFNFFSKLTFQKIEFIFDNEYLIEVIKSDIDMTEKLTFNLYKKKETVQNFDYPSKKMLQEIKRGIPSRILEDQMPPFIERLSSDKWLNEVTNEILSFEDLIYQFNDYLPEKFIDRYEVEIPSEFSEVFDSLEVYFIQEQRLVLREPVSERHLRRDIVITDTIEKYAKELSKLIKSNIDEYAEMTQTLDSSFPKRLFQDNNVDSDTTQLKEKLSLLQEKRVKISEYGLLKLDDDSIFQEDNIKDSDTKVLSLYIADNEKKLSVFDDLINRIDVFTNILNKRRFTFKSIEIDKDQGFIFKTHQDTPLNLTELSSGEQHEVVLLFELLFKAKENSLVLIDEPEISLHVVWQKAFLDDIKEIISLQKIDVVIATHSPQIINDKWELTVNLEDSYHGE